MTVEIGPGDLVWVTRAASVQFARRPFVARVIRVRDDLITYHGWCWLDVYQLNQKGDAVDRRSIFVQPVGLRLIDKRVTGTAGRVVSTTRQGGGRLTR
ncbi:hypothetical protein Vqi01_39790 [Micromonospora qiuiae]|uniref:Uncharacterized protein n=1 Tax=Micromonospora qiuiae TaxID=502268 RepID=A0ABQ4JF70_9ACTN|nr:hypothetical protein [Micromonospora qiuiae]GIJ28817.1 hypothetical protein Vqi01_39790 [Micromonospora qiuiae]